MITQMNDNQHNQGQKQQERSWEVVVAYAVAAEDADMDAGVVAKDGNNSK